MLKVDNYTMPPIFLKKALKIGPKRGYRKSRLPARLKKLL